MYNIHPILVHFPIALLVLYSVVKILPLQRLFPQVAWRQIERMLLTFGFLGALAALATGDLAEQIAKPEHDIVEMHSTFADISTILYGFLLLGEVASILNGRIFADKHWYKTAKISRLFERVLCNRVFSILLSLAGLICITVTGLLGGVMVYGSTSDPIAPFVLKLLGLTIS